jgi:uncharacterized protein YlzI (FlbEa/FlbD family)
MFIKLTRTDGRPIWINPEFIVTVEGRKDGGSIVVPGGDGLDYDVRESPQAVMDLCGGKVVVAEIPPLPAQPADPPPQEKAAEEVKVSEAPTKKRGRKASKAAAAPEPAPVPETPPAAEPPAVAAEAEPATPAEEKPAAKPRKRTSRKKPAIDLTDEQMVRLRKMAPGSRQKLLNTLVHLKVPNAEATAVALIANKVLEILPDNHVNWLAQ